MKVFYCDPNLSSYSGHWASYCESIVDGYNRLSIETTVVASKLLGENILPIYSPQKIFGNSPIILRPKLRLIKVLRIHLKLLSTVFKDLEKIEAFAADFIEQGVLAEYTSIKLFRIRGSGRAVHYPWLGILHIKRYLYEADMICRNLQQIKGITKTDLLQFEASSPAQLFGLILFVKSMGRFAPSVVISLNQKTGMKYVEKNFGRKILAPMSLEPALWRLASSSIKKFSLGRIKFISSEYVFTQLYSKLLRHPCALTPHPFGGETQKLNLIVRSTDLNGLTIGFVGFQYQPKGFHLVPSIVKRLLVLNLPVNIYIHDSTSGQYMPNEIGELKMLSQLCSNLKIDLSVKNGSEWQEVINACDIIVAPYLIEEYAVCGSGIASECISSGIPLITTAKTSLANRLSSYGLDNLLVDDYSETGFVQKISYAIANIHEIRKRSLNAKKLWHENNGPLEYAKFMASIYLSMQENA